MNLEIENLIPADLKRALLNEFGALPALPGPVELPRIVISERCLHCGGSGQEPKRETFGWSHGFGVFDKPTSMREFYSEHLGVPYEMVDRPFYLPARKSDEKTEDEITEEMRRDSEEIKKRAHADLERRGLLSRKSIPEVAEETGAEYVAPPKPSMFGMPVIEKDLGLGDEEFVFAPIEALPGVERKGDHYEVSAGDTHIGRASGIEFKTVEFDSEKYTARFPLPGDSLEVETKLTEEARTELIEKYREAMSAGIMSVDDIRALEGLESSGLSAAKAGEAMREMMEMLGSPKKPIRIKDRLKNFRVGEYAYIGLGIHGSDAWNEAGEFYLVLSVSEAVVLLEDREGKIHELEPLTLADSAHPDDF